MDSPKKKPMPARKLGALCRHAGTRQQPLSHPLLPCNAAHLAVYVIFEHQPLVVLRPFMTKLDAASAIDESHHIIHRPRVLQDVAAPPPRSVKVKGSSCPQGTSAHRMPRPPPVRTLSSRSGTDLPYPATRARERALCCMGLQGSLQGSRGGLLREQRLLLAQQRGGAERSDRPGSVAPTAS